MLSLNPCKNHLQSPILLKFHKQTHQAIFQHQGRKVGGKRVFVVKVSQGEGKEKRSFLSFEEAGLVEMSGLSPHERFLCRLTISSLNLLRVISEQEGCSIEELNAGRITDWFVKDKLKGEQNVDTAILQWDDPAENQL
ncbi:hypothetical protein AQUCO_03800182v1 [Aquilegia coerulea]|uniref:Uncharacterized protein n=1 Tax=Aquilegia coerulea TaxID=218851 RepID=A0A2G5CSY1_AQUCA|nr:hypothetical protein AQUCO_03800182v1 [Aquilegia coerulea]